MTNALANLFTDIADSIRSKTGSTEKLSPSDFPSQIDSISVGGGGAEGCATVTFMNGDNVLLTRPVYIGDDCPDPVTQGRIETPTKESTVQYHYSYKGWSEALTNITEDKVIYATYTETVRTYTVTFYDTDGTTVLKTEQVAYGVTPIAPNKDGFVIDSITPELVPVTGDVNYTVVYLEQSVDFATASWSEIASVCDGGLASKNFKVGDTRREAINGNNYTLEIIGINHDTVYDNGNLTGITVWVKDYDTAFYGHNIRLPWNKNDNSLWKKEEAVFSLLNTELQAVIKSVKKIYTDQSGYKSDLSTKIWSLSASEINCLGQTYKASNVNSFNEGEPYAKFSTSKTFRTGDTYNEIKTDKVYWLRSHDTERRPMYVIEDGSIWSNSSRQANLLPCFCI